MSHDRFAQLSEKTFDARHVENDIIKHFVDFCQYFALFNLKKVKKPRFYSKMA